MINEQEFMNQYDGFATEYSSFTVIGKDITPQNVIDALNEINPDFVAGNGKLQEGKEGYKAIGFTISKQEPDVIFDLTEKLSCIGYAQGDLEFHAAKKGRVYHGFTAKWDSFEKHDEDENIYDAFFTVTDDESKISIPSGGGAVEEDIARDYLNVVSILAPFRSENKFSTSTYAPDEKYRFEYGDTISGLTFVSCKINFLGDEDFNYTYARKSFYYEGTLVGELQHRSVSGDEIYKAVIYDKNSLGRTFESYLKKFTPYDYLKKSTAYEVWDVAHSDDVVEFPGRREIVENINETCEVLSKCSSFEELQEVIKKYEEARPTNIDIEAEIYNKNHPLHKYKPETNMEAINRGLYRMADEAYEYAGGEREVYHMRDLVQYISDAVDTLERRALVSQNHNKENSPIVLSTNELIVLTLLGNANEYFKKHHDSMEDLTKDYQNFRDKFLPKLKNVANYIPSENEPEEYSIMKYTKDYAQVFTSGKALFKTDLFKEPCNTFCKGVTDKMKEKAELNDFIKTGKLPALGKAHIANKNSTR